MNSPPITLKSDKAQNVKYGTENDYTVQLDSKEVVIHCKSGKHNHGSSKVILCDKIVYNWELRFYHGQLIAVHMNGEILAYAMKGKEGGMVRLVNLITDQKTLIKNMKSQVRDISFAFLKNEIIFGCVDEKANIFIYEIDNQELFIDFKLLLHIYHPNTLNNAPSNFKMVWCPYLPSADDDPDSGDDTAKMFVFQNGSKAEVWDISSILSRNEEGPIQPDENLEGYVEIDHSMHIVDVSFSSDGTAIATACLDGYVKFYQIYLVDNEKQKLLHKWIPHDGQPLSCLIFIDNILEYSSDSRFWKFALTGANHNSELKLWSCETWTCLQMIHFKIDPTSIIPNLFLKISIDYSGQYVIMSDINNKILYILQIKRNDAEKLVAVKSISQFLLPDPFLSFQVTKTEIGRTPSISNSNDEFYEGDDYEEEENDLNSVNITMLVIQPKKLQVCNIAFTPNVRDISEDKCDKSSNDLKIENVPKLDDLQSSVTLLIQQQTHKPQINLMTPEDFTPGVNSRSSSVRNSIEQNQDKVQNTTVEGLIEFDGTTKENFASGGSSPSREVQEILSLNNSTYSNPEYFDNLSKIQESEVPSSKNKELIWPKIPVVKDNGMVKEDNLTTDFNLNKDEVVRDDLYKTHLQTLNFRLTSLETALREQTVLIGSLKQEILSSKHKQNNVSIEVREDISKELEVAMSKHQLQMAKFLENLFSMHKIKEREMHDNLITSVSQVINKAVSDKIQTVNTHELKHAIVPVVINMMESWKHQMDMQLNQKTNQADAFLKESVTKILTSKTLTDSISDSLATAVTPSLEKSYRDMIKSIFIPTWEKICGNMFQQINDTFTQGTKEYTAWVENYVDRQKKVQEKGKDVTTQMNLAVENMKITSDQLLNLANVEIQKNMNLGFKTIQDKLSASIKDIVSEEVRLGFKSQTSVIENSVMNAVRSRSVTPASHVVDSHVKLSKIQQYLASGHIEEALKMALSAENLQYVVYVCEKVDVNTIFGGSTNLPQSCLLALIQQLSMDLFQNTEVKLNYIHAAILGLDRNDPDTKRFVNKILKDLGLQLTSFINGNPPYKHKSTARILLMAIENVGPSMFNLSI